uniref:Uncharacterized protein n=1 Tax=Trichinella nativa TaxID=6335 RepID=A0A0V1KH16_9BILA
MVIESFAGYSSMGWHLCSLRSLVGKSGVTLIGLPLYGT